MTSGVGARPYLGLGTASKGRFPPSAGEATSGAISARERESPRLGRWRRAIGRRSGRIRRRSVSYGERVLRRTSTGAGTRGSLRPRARWEPKRRPPANAMNWPRAGSNSGGSDGTRTRDLRLDRPGSHSRRERDEMAPCGGTRGEGGRRHCPRTIADPSPTSAPCWDGCWDEGDAQRPGGPRFGTNPPRIPSAQ